MKFIPLVLALCVVGADSAIADVLDVGSPPSTYLNIQDAIFASVEGDIIRVQGGRTYDGFTIDGKRLVLRNKRGTGRAVVKGKTIIRNIPNGSAASLSGFDFSGTHQTYATEEVGLEIQNCAGAIRLRECSVDGGWRQMAATVVNCDDVAMFDSAFVAGSSWGAGWEVGVYGRRGIQIRDSTVSAYGCSFEGASGTSASDLGENGGRGGDGIVAFGICRTFLSKCTLVGGGGGSGADTSIFQPFWCTSAGEGGSGFYGGFDTWFLDCVFQPGAGSVGWCQDDTLSYSADGQDATAGTFLPGSAVELRATNSMGDSEPLVLTFTGSPGDVVGWRSGEGPAYAFSPLRGPNLLWTPPNGIAEWHFAGRIGASGVLQVTLKVGDIPPFSHRNPYFQGVYRDSTSGAFYFTGSTDTLILDSGW